MRPALLSLVLFALPAAAGAQPLLPCERVDGATRAGIMPATRYEVQADAAGIRRVVLTLENGARTTTDFVPMGDGVSVRLTAFPDRRTPERARAVFNRAIVEPAGTYLFETWVRGPQDPVPLHNWYRLRCATSGATK